MAAVDDIKSNIDVNQIAQMLGTDPNTANEALDEALAQLVGAMDRNASNPEEAVNLTRALGDHVSSNAFGPQVDLNAVDATDGEKIVSHVFDPSQIQSLTASPSSSLIRKLLPILAPIVMSYLAGRFQEYVQQGQGGTTTRTQAPTSQGGLGDILGDLLGGGQQTQGRTQATSSQGGFGDILDMIIGGGQSQAQNQAYEQPTASSDGTFRNQPANDGGLRMPESTGAGAQQQQPTQQGSPQGGDILGGILKDILLGRR